MSRINSVNVHLILNVTTETKVVLWVGSTLKQHIVQQNFGDKKKKKKKKSMVEIEKNT